MLHPYQVCDMVDCHIMLSTTLLRIDQINIPSSIPVANQQRYHSLHDISLNVRSTFLLSPNHQTHRVSAGRGSIVIKCGLSIRLRSCSMNHSMKTSLFSLVELYLMTSIISSYDPGPALMTATTCTASPGQMYHRMFLPLAGITTLMP